MATPISVNNPTPTGVFARYIGTSGGTQTRVYWVQAIYPSGYSGLGQSQTLSNTAGSLDHNNQVYIEWNPMADAIGYLVFYTTSTTAPTTGAILVATTTAPNFTDQGQSNAPGTANVVGNGGFNVAKAIWNFAVDGGADALITLAASDTIPANALMVGATILVVTAIAGAGASITVGTSAGSAANSIKAVTAITSFTPAGTLVNGTVTFAAPVLMTAAGTVTITPSAALLTAGYLEIFVYYTTSING